MLRRGFNLPVLLAVILILQLHCDAWCLIAQPIDASPPQSCHKTGEQGSPESSLPQNDEDSCEQAHSFEAKATFKPLKPTLVLLVAAVSITNETLSFNSYLSATLIEAGEASPAVHLLSLRI